LYGSYREQYSANPVTGYWPGNYEIAIRHPSHHFIYRMCDAIIEQTLRVFVLVCAEILINYLNG